MTNELTLPERAAVALGASEHEKKLVLLADEAKTIIEIKNKDGREQCHSMMMTLKTARISIEKTGKTAREDAKNFANAVIAEEKRLIAITEAEETRLQGLRDQWDADREAERQAKIDAERQRIADIKARINVLERTPLLVVGQPSVVIDRIIQSFIDEELNESYEEFLEDAKRVHATALSALQEAMQTAMNSEIEAARAKAEQEAEAARLKAEREELARLRAEAEARRKEDERKAAEERARQEAEMKAEREKQEAELAVQRAEIARQQAERDAEIAAKAKAAKEAQDAAAAELAAERAELERQQAELATTKRAAEEAEAERIRLQEAADQALADAREPSPSLAELLHRVAPPEVALAICQRPSRPTDDEIIAVLALHYCAHESKVIEWLLDMNLIEASEKMAATI